MRSKKIYCSMCSFERAVYAEYEIRYIYNTKDTVNNLCNRHTQGMVRDLRRIKIETVVRQIAQPVEMLWAR